MVPGARTKMLSEPYFKRVSRKAPACGYMLGASCIQIPDALFFVEIGFFQM